MTTNFWGSGRGAIAGCHCSSLRFGGRVTTNAGGVDGGRCYGWRRHFFFTLITQKLVFAIWGLCWFNFVLVCTGISNPCTG